MPRMMLSPDRLSPLLAPQGFWLRDADFSTKQIRFVRQSPIPRLYELLNIRGQGKRGEAVYATTAISGSASQAYDHSIAENEHALLYHLETEKDRHWTLLRTKEDAVAWEKRLAECADSYCRATAHAKGPLLADRLQPAFADVDRYLSKLGDLDEVFNSEYQFFLNAPVDERIEAERLASLIGSRGESSDDISLACLILFQFGAEGDGSTNLFHGKKWHEDPDLRTRIFSRISSVNGDNGTGRLEANRNVILAMDGGGQLMFLDPARFDFVAALESEWEAIRSEYLALPSDLFDPWVQRQMHGGGWSVFGLYALGRPIPAACAACPRTAQALKGVPGLSMAGFSRLAPHTHVTPHVGWAASVYRLHLALAVPPGCRLRVAGETREWQEGQCLIFDDTVEHEAWNDSAAARGVLLLDFLRPGLTGPVEDHVPEEVREYAQRIFAARDGDSAAQNESALTASPPARVPNA